METRTLQMQFQCGDRTANVTLRNPRADLTAAAVQAVGDELASNQVFAGEHGVYGPYLKALMIQRMVTELK